MSNLPRQSVAKGCAGPGFAKGRKRIWQKPAILLTYYASRCTMLHTVHSGAREIDFVTDGDARETSNGKFDSELRRGVLVLAVLSQLRTPEYGYSLRQALADQGMPIEEGTLYPLLRRLESQGLLESQWRMEDGPPRRYYTLSADGARHYRALSETWSALAKTVNRLIADKK
jgi:DNA-binding PadR family transcriptional regulator